MDQRITYFIFGMFADIIANWIIKFNKKEKSPSNPRGDDTRND